RLIFASSARWSVGIGSTLVEFHPTLERRLYAYRRIDPLEVSVLNVRFDFLSNVDERFFGSGAISRCVTLGTNTADNFTGLFQDCVAIEIIEIPSCRAGIFGELSAFFIERGKPVTKKHATGTVG